MQGVAFWCGVKKRTVVTGEGCPCLLTGTLCREYGGPWSPKTSDLTAEESRKTEAREVLKAIPEFK